MENPREQEENAKWNYLYIDPQTECLVGAFQVLGDRDSLNYWKIMETANLLFGEIWEFLDRETMTQIADFAFRAGTYDAKMAILSDLCSYVKETCDKESQKVTLRKWLCEAEEILAEN